MLLPGTTAPAPVQQHPLHYPHGTLFMAPGPAGQTVGIPDSPPLKALMVKEFRNYMAVHERYNLDFKPASDTWQARALRLGVRQMQRRAKEEDIIDRRAARQLKKCGQGSVWNV